MSQDHDVKSVLHAEPAIPGNPAVGTGCASNLGAIFAGFEQISPPNTPSNVISPNPAPTSAETECLRSISDAAVNHIYDELRVSRPSSYARATRHPLFEVALYLNNRALGSRMGAA